ncbi:cytochrome C [Leptobacterium flavescens]|uniref:Cytochrome C n=1 Tax=Leptobacterium flavescens TaxID=472055 RepID=A0A6P0UTC0_9FLAO|nr:multiheme c-type cytochrome [Leptobacterium flavescens]NER13656.1 cytochrome C [Leptobacterium flavescens]
MSNNNIYISKSSFWLISVILIISFSCKHEKDEYHTITDKIEAESKKYHHDSIMGLENHLEGLKMIEISEGGHTFLIPERKSAITSYSCLECHSTSLKELKSEGTKKAHWDIQLAHANENTMNCATCHNGNDMNQLQSLTGNQIDFNNSYLLCSQCHSKQFEDWKGGAHGKRINSWTPPRASMSCVNCHNPHQPHFESRWPSRYNTEKVKERQ